MSLSRSSASEYCRKLEPWHLPWWQESHYVVSESCKLMVPDNDSGAALRMRHRFARDRDSSQEKLLVTATSCSLLAVARLMPFVGERFRVMYVKVEEFGPVDRGRYLLPGLLGFDGCCELLLEYSRLFLSDGRANLWISRGDLNAGIVYDQHDVIHYYSGTARASFALLGIGVLPGKVPLPYRHPHRHKLTAALDEDESRLVSHPDTHWEPLVPGLDTLD